MPVSDLVSNGSVIETRCYIKQHYENNDDNNANNHDNNYNRYINDYDKNVGNNDN